MKTLKYLPMPQPALYDLIFLFRFVVDAEAWLLIDFLPSNSPYQAIIPSKVHDHLVFEDTVFKQHSGFHITTEVGHVLESAQQELDKVPGAGACIPSPCSVNSRDDGPSSNSLESSRLPIH